MTEDVTPPRPSAPVGIALALVAAACLLGASFTNQWLVNSNPDETIGFGLRANFVCGSLLGETSCAGMSNSAFVSQWRDRGDKAAEYVSGVFVPMGWATLIECLLAAAGLVATAAIAIARKRPDLPIATTTVALLGLMASLVTGCVFVATKPGEAGYVGVGLSFWLFGAGAVLGTAGTLMLAKVNRPDDPDLLEDAMNPDQF